MQITNWELVQKTLDFLRLRKRAYQLTFKDPKNNEVLKDLARFCRANKSPEHHDLFRLGVAVGRREVWLRIQEHLHLQPEELYEIYNKPTTLLPQGKD